MSLTKNDFISKIKACTVHLTFDTTFHCNMECPICIANAGPKISKDKNIPTKDMEYYANQPNIGNILITGGEVSTLGLDYFRDAAFICADSGHQTVIKTNAKWVREENAADYADVIYQLSKKYNDIQILEKTKFANFGVDISVGKDHENSNEYALEFLTLLPDKNSKSFEYNLHFVASDYAEARNFQRNLESYGMRVNLKGYIVSPGCNVFGKITQLERIIKLGRARINNIGETPAPLAIKTTDDLLNQIMDRGRDTGKESVCLDFYPNGFVYLIDCDMNFLAGMRYKENNVPMDLEQIVIRLAENAYAKHLR